MIVQEGTFNMDQANADLRDLASLYAARGLDLCERLFGLENAGTVTFQVDLTAAIGARDGVTFYKLANELLADLAAMRAEDVHPDEIDGGHS
jgi:hypothetical protein